MTNRWENKKINDIAEKVGMGPFGSSIKVETFVSQGIPIISGQHLHGFRLEESNGFNFISEEHASRLKNSNVFRGDVIFTHAGNIENLSYIPENSQYERYIVSQRQFFMRCDKTQVLPSWVVYYFKTHKGRHDLIANSSPAGVPSIAQPVSYLRQLKIPVPPLPIQQRIVYILNILDDKIELNRQTNATLEAMAQAIFKEWFVNFNFPGATGEMVESELGPIPRGWRVGKLGEMIINFDRKRIPLSSRERENRKGPFPYYGAASILDYVDDYLFEGIYLLMGEDGTVITEDEKPILQYVSGKFWVNNHAHVLQGKDPFSTEYIFLQLTNTNIKHIVTGAVQPKINQQNMNNVSVIIPEESPLLRFQEIISPIFKNILEIEHEISTLVDIRDSLLPKLMSGEIEV